MFSQTVLYLTLEGVLLPNARRPPSNEVDGIQLGAQPHFRKLTGLISQHRICVVINSVWVLTLSFKSVMDMLPEELRIRVVGATVPGNRLLRHHRTAGELSKSEWLACDIRRREPSNLAVLESDSLSVPIPLRDRAVIVPQGLWAAVDDDWSRLRRILCLEDEESAR
jgi:hypothetical protein